MSAVAAGKGAGTRAIVSWALFDFAGAPFTTLVVTFIYATYFTQAIASDAIHGTVLWSRAVSVTALIVALVLATARRVRGSRRLSQADPRRHDARLRRRAPPRSTGSCRGRCCSRSACVVVANIAFEFAAVFNNAFLPDIAPRDRIGRLSGIGWACGYVGGLLALVAALVMFVQPATPWFGFAKAGGENIRATNLLVAIWYVVFSIPLFLWVPEDRSRVSRAGHVVADTFAQLRRTFSEIRKYRQIVRFLFARLIYNDGLVTVFAFGGIYAANTFGFSLQQVLEFGIVINVAAVVGAVSLGFLDDKIGGKRTIAISLVGLMGATVLAMLATSATMFWIAGIAIGIFAGPNQAASRSLMARFVPPSVENEFFGFFAFSGKLTAFIGPFLLGVLTEISGSQRVGVGVVVLLFIVGLIALTFVDEREGARIRG